MVMEEKIHLVENDFVIKMPKKENIDISKNVGPSFSHT